MNRFDRFGSEDAGYRKLTLAVRRALRRLLPLLNEKARDQYMALEQATNAREVYSTDAVAQWAYALGASGWRDADAAVARPQAGYCAAHTPSKSSVRVTPSAFDTATSVANVTLLSPLSIVW